MSEIDDEEIERIILAELAKVNDDDQACDDNLNEEEEQALSDKEEEPIAFDDLTKVFTSYYTDFMSNIEKEINDLGTNVSEIDTILSKSNQGLKELSNKEDQEDSSDEQQERLTAILSSRPTSKLGVDRITHEVPNSHREPENKENNNEDENSQCEESSEVKIIYAWIETDKEIEKINQQRWDEYKSFLKTIDQSRETSREICQQKTAEEIEAQKARQLELEKNLEQLTSNQNTKLMEESQKVIDELESELQAERDRAMQFNRELETRQEEIKYKAAVMIQKHFRGYRIRLRIGDDINALREKARRKYQKELIVKKGKQQNKQKAKEYHKIRQQKGLESGRSSAVSHSCISEASTSSSSGKKSSYSRKNDSHNSSDKTSLDKIDDCNEETAEISYAADESLSKTSDKHSYEEETDEIQPEYPDNSSEREVKSDELNDGETSESTDKSKDDKLNDTTTRDCEKTIDDKSSSISVSMEIDVSSKPKLNEDNVDAVVEIDDGDDEDNSNMQEVKEEGDSSDNSNNLSNEATNCKNSPIEICVSQSIDSDKSYGNTNEDKIDKNLIESTPTKKTAYVLPIQQNMKSEDIIEESKKDNEEDNFDQLKDSNNFVFTDEVQDVIHEDIYQIKQQLNEDEEMKLPEAGDNETIIFVDEDKSMKQDIFNIDFKGDYISPESQEVNDGKIDYVDFKGDNVQLEVQEERISSRENVDSMKETSSENDLRHSADDNKSSQPPNVRSPFNIPPADILNTPRYSVPESDSGLSTIMLTDNNAVKLSEANDEFESETVGLTVDEEEEDDILTPIPNEEEHYQCTNQYLSPPEHLQNLWAMWIKKTHRKLEQNLNINAVQRQKRYPRSAKKLAKLPPEVLSKFTLKSNPLNAVTVLRLHQVNNYRLAGLDSHCPALEVLMANCCNLLTLEGLESCNNLQYIDVRNNQIEYIDLGCTSKLQLFYVNLSNNKITVLHGLDVCVSLKELNVSHNKLTRLTPDTFQSFSQTLSHLDASHNQMVSVPALQLCPQMQCLDLSHNNLSEIGELPHLLHLRQLNVSNNSLCKLPPLWNNCLLQELQLDQNSIRDLSPLKSYWLPNLCYLSLSNNNLFELTMLPLPLLMQLNVSNNQFDDLPQLLENLKHFPHLSALNMLTTPCFASQSAQQVVIKSLPNLSVLNENYIKERSTQKIVFDESEFLRVCLNFRAACRHQDDKLLDYKNKLSSSETKDILLFVKHHKRYHNHLSQLVHQQRRFQENRLLYSSKDRNGFSDKRNQHLKEKISLSPDEAATKIAAMYRGYQVRKRMNDQIDEIFHRCAIKIQALWRGYRVRKWIRNALEKIKIDVDISHDTDEDLMPSVDVNQFNEADVDRMFDDIKLPSSGKDSNNEIPPKAHITEPRRHSLTSQALPTIKSQKSAWTQQEQQQADVEHMRPLSVTSRRTDLIIDLDSFRSNSIASRNTPQPLAPISSSRKSKKAEAIMQEWGFQGETCAKSMLQRAKKMKYNTERKQKLSQMDPQSRLNLIRKLEKHNPPPSVRIQTKSDPIIPNTGKIDYFRAKALEKMQLEARQYKEMQNRTYEWVFEQSTVRTKPMSPGLPSENNRITLPKIPSNDLGRLVTQPAPLLSNSTEPRGKSASQEES